MITTCLCNQLYVVLHPDMKFSIKFFLSLYILLLGGYGQVYAKVYQDCVCYSSSKTIDWSEHASVDSDQNDQTLITKSGHCITENEEYKLRATDNENEDDDQLSVKKYFEACNYFPSDFYGQLPGYFFSYTIKRLPHCKHFSYFSSDTYLKLRVLRI
jgi:hypothetical protein